MQFLRSLTGAGAILSVVQFLIGVDLFMRGWALVWPHVGIAVTLLAILILVVLKSSEARRVRRHGVITLILLVIQGAVGLDMLTRGATPMMEGIHWLFGALTTGSFLATWSIARKTPA